MKKEWYKVEGSKVEDEATDAILFVHAIKGSYRVDTIRILGFYTNRQLVILIDCGSTTNFIDKRVAQELKLELITICPTTVMVIDGRKLCCEQKYSYWNWKMQGIEFQFEVRVLELGGFDMILAANWLKTHNSMLFDFEASFITITRQQKPLLLQGIGEAAL